MKKKLSVYLEKLTISSPEKKIVTQESEPSEIDTLLTTLFYQFDEKKIGKLSKKKYIQQEFLGLTCTFSGIERIISVLTTALTTQTQQSIRIDLKPAKTKTQLINALSHYLPLESVKKEQKHISVNTIHHHIKKGEKANLPMFIDLYTFSSFLITKLPKAIIPASTDSEQKIHIFGLVENGQPTALVFLLAGNSSPKRTQRETKKVPIRVNQLIPTVNQ